jgi:hypothetical protein
MGIGQPPHCDMQPCILLPCTHVCLLDDCDHAMTMLQAWYISQPGIDNTTYDSSEGAERMISYATSLDGVSWVRPMLPFVQWNGSDTNILIKLDGSKEASYACVFIEPGASNISRRCVFHFCLFVCLSSCLFILLLI